MAVEAYFDAETVWTCEFDKHASKVIDAHFDVPNHGNLKTTDWTQVEPIDILTAGYPCQPFSHAGSRKGADDERHLWPYIKEIIGILRPRFVVLENVRGHFGLGFREVLSDLASIGYDARWTLIRASDVGAPHRRERLFILAYPNCSRCTRTEPSDIQAQQPWDSSSHSYEYTYTDGQRCCVGENHLNSFEHQRQSQPITSRLVETIITHTNCVSHDDARRANGNFYRTAGQEFNRSNRIEPRFSLEMASQAIPAPLDEGRLNVKFVEYMMGLPHGWVSSVNLSRAQMLKILGNGVVPQQAYSALKLLHSYPQELSTGTSNLWETPKINAVT